MSVDAPASPLEAPAPAQARPAPRRRRSWRRRLSWAAFGIALLLVAEGLLVLTWKEPVTSFLQGRSQAALARELEPALAAPESRREVGEAGMRRDAAALLGGLALGDAVARLEIPRLGLRQAVIEGTDPPELRRGPGHYPDTALPGLGRTVAIAGHRTTWGAPFRHIDDLRPGDEVRVVLPYGTASYRVRGTRIVENDDFSILADVGRDRLVLTACHPLYSARQRLVVTAELDAPGRAAAEPRGA